MKIHIVSFAYINSAGFGNHAKHTRWSDIGVENFTQCQWRHLFHSSFDRFGRFDSLVKQVVAAVELLRIPISQDHRKDEDTAIYLGTETGSFKVDMLFYKSVTQPGGASPLLFSYTLPSTAIGEVAIRYNITGPNLCLLVGRSTGLTTLWESAVMLNNKEVSRCITVINNARLSDIRVAAKSETHAVLLSSDPPEHPCQVLCSMEFDDSSQDCHAVRNIEKVYEFITKPSDIPLWLEAPNGYNTSSRLRIEHSR